MLDLSVIFQQRARQIGTICDEVLDVFLGERYRVAVAPNRMLK
ncbi:MULTISPECIES: hypothetical protein [unclassified Bradyrhizobium]|nr:MULTISPECIES: hypothetical protein [unclassified Bradyrhizobium]